MKKNRATFRNRRTRVTLERIFVGQLGGACVLCSGSPGPVYGDTQEGGNAGQREHERVSHACELARAKRELESVDGPRGDVERGVAPDRPVDRAQEERLGARVDDPRV